MDVGDPDWWEHGVDHADAGSDRMAELYALHAPRAARLAYLLTSDRELAEDLTQEAFVRLMRRYHDLRNPASFDAYLRTTVVNLARKHFRHRRVERTHLEKERGRISSTSDAGVVETREEAWQALRMLPGRQRAALVLRYYEDLSEQETADILGVTVAAVKSLVQRGVATLRKEGVMRP